MTPRRKILLTVGVLVLIVAIAVAFGVWRVVGSAPQEVSLADAVADAEQAQVDGAPESTVGTDPSDGDGESGTADATGADGNDADVTDADATAPSADNADGNEESGGDTDAVAAGEGVNGTWTVDAQSGPISLDDEVDGSFVGFRVDEELARIGAFTAVGRTGSVSGTLEIADERVTEVSIAVDLTTLQTDDSRRDGAVRRALNTRSHPTAQFTLTEDLDIAGGIDGNAISRVARGDLTVNGITLAVEMNIEAQLVGETIAVVGSIEIAFADFDVNVPQVPVVLAADDHGIMEFQLLFERP